MNALIIRISKGWSVKQKQKSPLPSVVTNGSILNACTSPIANDLGEQNHADATWSSLRGQSTQKRQIHHKIAMQGSQPCNQTQEKKEKSRPNGETSGNYYTPLCNFLLVLRYPISLYVYVTLLVCKLKLLVCPQLHQKGACTLSLQVPRPTFKNITGIRQIGEVDLAVIMTIGGSYSQVTQTQKLAEDLMWATM